MTLEASDYFEAGDVSFGGSVDSPQLRIPPRDVVVAVVGANRYLAELRGHFTRIGFNLYESLGQRNISGFVGEVFSRTLAKQTSSLIANPHPDGRPDLIDVSSVQARDHLRIRCYIRTTSDRPIPVKAQFTPFKFGGVEVKSTIGDFPQGFDTPRVGTPRCSRIRALTFWGHHRDCCNLLGIYYDYFVERDGAPQIVAVLHAKLEEADWNKVSVGKSESKKTSNTSLNSSGRAKLGAGLVALLNTAPHRDALVRCGVTRLPLL